MTDKQWGFWERRNRVALINRYGRKGLSGRLAKLKEKTRRNAARINSCKLHDFDWKKAMADHKARMETWSEEVPMPVSLTADCYCRCKNCGGKISIMYAAPYMEAVERTRALIKAGKEV